jgi:hypothetical protein
MFGRRMNVVPVAAGCVQTRCYSKLPILGCKASVAEYRSNRKGLS